MRRPVFRLLAVLALTAATVMTVGSGPAVGATTVDAPVGTIHGAGTKLGSQLVIAASTVPGRHGSAQIVSGGRTVSVVLDCVRTYGYAGAILLPMAGGTGYASGVGSDGSRYYILVNVPYGFEVTTTAGPPVGFSTCGVGYLIPAFAPSPLTVVPQSTLIWTVAG